MRSALLLICLLLPFTAPAASLNGCDTSWRLGNQVIRAGDDVARALKVLDRSSHRVTWLRGPSSRSWTLATTGANPRTVHIRLKDGRLEELCQYSH